MKTTALRSTTAVAAIGLATVAQAAETTYAGMTLAAWGSIAAVGGIVILLVWVYRKTN